MSGTHGRFIEDAKGIVLANDTGEPVHKFLKVVGNVHVGVEGERMRYSEELGVLDGLWRLWSLDHGGRLEARKTIDCGWQTLWIREGRRTRR